MELGLRGRTAVVTGASRGIGLAVVRALVGEGVTVYAGARHTTPELAELADGGSVHVTEVDLSTPDGPARLVESAGQRVHILVNNVAAAPLRMTGFTSVTDEEWVGTFDATFFSAVRATRAAIPLLLAAGGGSIVTVSSVNAFLPSHHGVDYSSAKAALSCFAKALANEFGKQGIRSNTVSPGPVRTDMWLGPEGVAQTIANATGGDPEKIAEEAAATTATGRFSDPEEIAAMC